MTSQQEEVFEGSFVAETPDGAIVEIQRYRNYIVCHGRYGEERIAGRTCWRTMAGHPVRIIEHGRYEIEDDDRIVTAISDNPNDP